MKQRLVTALVLLATVAVVLLWRLGFHGWPLRAILRGVPSDTLQLLEPLDRLITVDLQRAPLTEVVAHLEGAAGIRLQLDTQSLADHGIAPETPITLRLQDAPLAWAFDRLEREHDLHLGVRDGGLIVTVRGEGLVTRFHPLATTGVLEPLEPKYLEELLHVIEPMSWGSQGRFAGSQLMPGGVLVRQSIRNQLRITQLLDILSRPLSGTRPLRIDGRPFWDERLARSVAWTPGLEEEGQLSAICDEAGLRLQTWGDEPTFDGPPSGFFDQSFCAPLLTHLSMLTSAQSAYSRFDWSIQDGALDIGLERYVVCVYPFGRELRQSWPEGLVRDLTLNLGFAGQGACFALPDCLVVQHVESVQWEIEVLLSRARRAMGIGAHTPELLAEEERAERALLQPVRMEDEPSLGETHGQLATHLSGILGVPCVAMTPRQPLTSPLQFNSPEPSIIRTTAMRPSNWLEWLASRRLTGRPLPGGAVALYPSQAEFPVTRVDVTPRRTSGPRSDLHGYGARGNRSQDELQRFVDLDFMFEAGSDQFVVTRLGLAEHQRLGRLLSSLAIAETSSTETLPDNPDDVSVWRHIRETLRRPLPERLEASSLSELFLQLSTMTGVDFELVPSAEETSKPNLVLAPGELPLGAALGCLLLPRGRTFDVHTNAVLVRPVELPAQLDVRLYPLGQLFDGWDRESRETYDDRRQRREELTDLLWLATGRDWPDYAEVCFFGDTLVARLPPRAHDQVERLLARLARPGAPAWGELAWRDEGWTAEFDAALNRPLTLVVDFAVSEEQFLRQVAAACGLEAYLALPPQTVPQRDSSPRSPASGALFVEVPAREVLARVAAHHGHPSYIHHGVLAADRSEAVPDGETSLYDYRPWRPVYQTQRDRWISRPDAWRTSRRLDAAPPSLRIPPAENTSSEFFAVTCGPWLAVDQRTSAPPRIEMLDDLLGAWSGAPPLRTPEAWRTPITCSSIDQPLVDVVRKVAEAAGLSLVALPGAASRWSQLASLRLEHQSLADTLPPLLAAHGLVGVWEHNTLVIRPAADPPATWVRGSLSELHADASLGAAPGAVMTLGFALHRPMQLDFYVALDQFLISGAAERVEQAKQMLAIPAPLGSRDWKVAALASDNLLSQELALVWISPEDRRTLIAYLERLASLPTGELDEEVPPILEQTVDRAMAPELIAPVLSVLQRGDVPAASQLRMLADVVDEGDQGLIPVLRLLSSAGDEAFPNVPRARRADLLRPLTPLTSPDKFSAAVVPEGLRLLDVIRADPESRHWLNSFLEALDPSGEVRRRTLVQWSQGTPEDVELASRLRTDE